MQPDEMACLLLQNGSFPNTYLSYIKPSTSDLFSLKRILYFCYEMYSFIATTLIIANDDLEINDEVIKSKEIETELLLV
jgi:hypothetical protein